MRSKATTNSKGEMMEPMTIAICVAITGVYGWLIRLAMAGKKNGDYVRMADFEKHKESVQYKDTCSEVVKRIDEKSEERHKTTLKTLDRIEALILNNGNAKPRVQT